MKKYAAWFFVVLFIFVTQEAKAHSVLESSSPAAGEVVTNPLTEIVLAFDTKMEKGSRFAIRKNVSGEVLQPEKVEMNKNRLTGSFNEPINDGYYTIEWKVVGADGHLVTGNVPFKIKFGVNKSEETGNSKTAEIKESVTIEQPSRRSLEKTTLSPFIVSLIMLLIVFAVSIMIMLWKKKR